MAARAQPPGITAVPIWGDDGSGGGPTPPTTVDRFEASIIVGNVPNGDPATAQAAPFQYVPDTGNGAGIAQAIADAAGTGLPTRIRIRPGTYAFASSLPRTIPSNVTLEGSGEGVTVISGTAALRSLFDVSQNANIRDLTISLPNPAGNVQGTYVVRLNEGAVAERVTIEVGDGNGTQDDDSLTALFQLWGSSARVLDCLGVYEPPMFSLADSPRVACYAIGPRTSGPVVSDVLVRGRCRGAAELVFVASSASHFELDIQGDGAATGTINGSYGQGRVKSRIERGAPTRPWSLVLSGIGGQYDVQIVDGDATSVDGYIDCTAESTQIRAVLTGADSGACQDGGIYNAWADPILRSAAAVSFELSGTACGVANITMIGPGGDLTLSGTDCQAIGGRISGSVVNTGVTCDATAVLQGV